MAKLACEVFRGIRIDLHIDQKKGGIFLVMYLTKFVCQTTDVWTKMKLSLRLAGDTD